MRALVSAIDAISRACGGIAALFVVVLVVLMVYDAVMRYAFSAPTIWAFEVGTYMLGALFLLSIGYALSGDAHVRVDLLYDWLPRRWITVVDLIGFAVFLLPALIWITSGLWEYFHDAWRTGERSGGSAWNPQVWPFRLVMFVGFAAFSLQVLAEIVKRIAVLRGRPIDGSRVPSHEMPT